MQDPQGVPLGDPGGITVIELPKLNISQVTNSQERWIQFFKEGETFTDPKHLPEWMQTEEMEQAMTTLEQFSEKEVAYHQYQARQDYLREQATLQKGLDEWKQKALAALAAKEIERKAKEAALAKIKKLEQQIASKEN